LAISFTPVGRVDVAAVAIEARPQDGQFIGGLEPDSSRRIDA